MNDEINRLLKAASLIESKLNVRTCVIGGIARGVWAKRRNTFDVDVLVDTADLAPIVAHAADVGLATVPREVAAFAPSGMTRLRLPEELTGEVRLDVIARTHDYYSRVFGRSVRADIDGISVRIASAEDIVVLKVLADRPQDRADVAAIVEAQGDALDRGLIREELAALGLDPPALLG